MPLSTSARRRAASVVAAAALVGTTALVAGGASTAAPTGPGLPQEIVNDVKVKNVISHLREFQRIADANADTRAAGSPGYEQSADYVHDKLAAAGYDVEYQSFEFTYTEELRETLTETSPTSRDLPVDVMTYSPATPVGGITAPLAAVPVDATPGCEASDFASQDYTGKIALIQRGGCTFAQKSSTAADAGAVGAIVYNNDTVNPDLLVNGTLGAPGATPIPTGGTSLNVGQDLAAEAAAGPVTVTLDLAELTEQRITRNVIAESPGGDADNVVMAGAHLDSVPEGPGINDNGTGSAGLLEVALQMADDPTANKTRFAWWSAEEFGLIGSEYYVDNLPQAERDQIALYLNFDMIGSPNYMFGIYDGDDSDGEGAGPGPAGSAEIEDVFESYYDRRGLPHNGTDFSGRSDYGPFIAVGIPSGGLFTGAEGIKTEEQAQWYGGVAGQAYDPCYHQACDSSTPVADGADADLYAQLMESYSLVGNVNKFALQHNAKSAGFTMATFAEDTSSLPAASAKVFARPHNHSGKVR
jgi:Zn-dependent M28 family amino/carboxypeptidase